jgi:hypothetical protein
MKRFAAFTLLLLLIFASINVLAKTYSKAPNDPLFDGYERGASYGYNPPGGSVAPLDELFMYFSGPTRFSSNAKYRAIPKGYESDIKVGDKQVAGTSIDTVWYNYTIGDPETIIGLVECGVFWNDGEAVYQFFLNKGELAKYPPEWGKDKDGNLVPMWDRNNDGRFNVADYEPDIKKMSCTGFGAKEAVCKSSYTYKSGGYNGHPAFFKTVDGKIIFHNNTNKMVTGVAKNEILDPQDLITTFTDGNDDDGNGYKDDICGWDFFDDDNDPEDSSSVALSVGHGMFEARQTAAQGNNDFEGIGVCPDCSLIPV